MSTVYLPAEVFRRELIPRCVLATYLALCGFRTIFGHRWYVTNYALANGKKNDVFLTSHSLPAQETTWLSDLIERDVKFVGTEEEAVFDTVKYEDQLMIRSQNPKDFSTFDRWLCWGDRDYEVLVRRLSDPRILRKYGTPRSALLGRIGKEIFSEEISKSVKANYGDFILIATSFAPTSQSHRDAILELHSNNPAFDLKRFERDISIVNNKNSIEKHAVALQTILRNTNFNIVLRPYIDKGDSYTNILFESLLQADKKRVFVDKRPFALPLILACSALIHSGSTVGIESRALLKKTIALNCFLTRDPLEIEPKLSTVISDCPRNENELLEVLSNGSQTTATQFSSWITNADEFDFYKNFSEDLLSMGAVNVFGGESVNLNSAKRSPVYKIATSLRRGPIYKYDLEKRPRYGFKSIERIVKSTQKALGLKSLAIEMKQIERDTYLIQRMQ